MQLRLSLFNMRLNSKNTKISRDMQRDFDTVANIYIRCTNRRKNIIKESKKTIIKEKIK